MVEHRASGCRLVPSRTEVLVLLVVISGGLLLLAPLFKGPVGKRIPAEPPNEAFRVVHPAGFSVVVPPDWKVAGSAAGLSKDLPSLGLIPRHPLPVRSSASIYIVRYDRHRPPELDRAPPGQWHAIQLQGRPAYEGMEVVRNATFPDEPALSRYTLYVQADEDWYMVSYCISERLTELPQIIREYINTFRIEPFPEGESRRDPE